VLESPYESTGAKWLDAENLIIDRPYGEPPIVWNITDNSVAVVEWPRPLPNFAFEPLRQTMLLADGPETFVWDIPTGELLGSTAIQGRLIELPNQVIVLQEVEFQEDDEWRVNLRAVNLGNEDVLWEIPWGTRELTLRDDGLYGFSLNYETGTVDILDMQSGRMVGEVRVPELYFDLTEDWNWLTFSGSPYYVVWGLDENADLFSDTPHIRTTGEVPVYYEANTTFPTDFMLQPDSYRWVRNISADGQWLLLVTSGGSNFWIPAEGVEDLRDLEDVPVYDPL
jgi:hypothetical protein